MKKLLSFILALTVISSCLTLAGCNVLGEIFGTTGTTTTTTTKPTTTTTTTTGSSSDTGEIVWEDKIYCNTTIDDNYVPGEVIVVLDKAISEVNKVHSKDFFTGVDILNIEDLTHFSNPDVIVDKENFNQVLLLTLSEQTKEAVIDAIKIIEQIVGVKYVGANNIDEVDFAYPDDPYYSFTTSTVDQWGLDSINVSPVWDFSTGSDFVRVGVIDTGVSSHMDLDRDNNTN